jgi:AraC-like DNA-binding protein
MIEIGFAAPALERCPHREEQNVTNRQTTAPPAPLDNDQKIDQSIAYMLRHLNQALSATQLASRAGFSVSHYFAVFKRRTGGSPIDYFIGLRMGKACRLLVETTLPVKDIAAQLGYNDPFYFSRVFKSVNALAPRAYRTTRRTAALEWTSPPCGHRIVHATHSFLHSHADGCYDSQETQNKRPLPVMEASPARRTRRCDGQVLCDQLPIKKP